MSKTIKILFTASVLANVLLLGIASGIAYHAWSDYSWRRGLPEDIKPETRHMMARTFQKTHGEVREAGKKARAARKDLMVALGSKKFDGQKFEKAMHEFQEAQQDMIRIKMTAMKELAGELPVEEREKLAEKMSGFLDRGPRYDHPRRYGPDREGSEKRDKD